MSLENGESLPEVISVTDKTVLINRNLRFIADLGALLRMNNLTKGELLPAQLAVELGAWQDENSTRVISAQMKDQSYTRAHTPFDDHDSATVNELYEETTVFLKQTMGIFAEYFPVPKLTDE